MATLTKGASNVLFAGGHAKVATLVGIKADAAVLRKHSLLKQDRGQISHRAESIGTGKVSVDGVSKVGGLAKRLGAEFDHKQMPPIQHLEPPEGAEHLVGSIQAYLIRRFDIKAVPLLVNYRSNKDLVEYTRSLGYPAKLRAEFPTRDLQLLQGIATVTSHMPAGLPVSGAYEELLRPERRVTAFVHEDPTSSQANELEAGLVAGLTYVARQVMAKELYEGSLRNRYGNWRRIQAVGSQVQFPRRVNCCPSATERIIHSGRVFSVFPQ
jgi:prepilin-type processing-associated H-X9-DG protein